MLKKRDGKKDTEKRKVREGMENRQINRMKRDEEKMMEGQRMFRAKKNESEEDDLEGDLNSVD